MKVICTHKRQSITNQGGIVVRMYLWLTTLCISNVWIMRCWEGGVTITTSLSQGLWPLAVMFFMFHTVSIMQHTVSSKSIIWSLCQYKINTLQSYSCIYLIQVQLLALFGHSWTFHDNTNIIVPQLVFMSWFALLNIWNTRSLSDCMTGHTGHAMK